MDICGESELCRVIARLVRQVLELAVPPVMLEHVSAPWKSIVLGEIASP